MKVTNMKIGIRLGIAFASILILVVFMVITGYYFINKIDDELDHIVTNNQVRTDKSYEALNALNEINSSIRTYALLDNQSLKDQSLKNIQVKRQEYKDAIAKIEELDKTDKGKTLI